MALVARLYQNCFYSSFLSSHTFVHAFYIHYSFVSPHPTASDHFQSTNHSSCFWCFHFFFFFFFGFCFYRKPNNVLRFCFTPNKSFHSLMPELNYFWHEYETALTWRRTVFRWMKSPWIPLFRQIQYKIVYILNRN